MSAQDIANIRDAQKSGKTLNALEMNMHIAELFMSAGMKEMALAGAMNAEAAVYLRQAAQTNATVLPYTHAKLAVTEGDNGSGGTVDMLEDIVRKRREKQQALARQYASSAEIIGEV